MVDENSEIMPEPPADAETAEMLEIPAVAETPETPSAVPSAPDVVVARATAPEPPTPAPPPGPVATPAAPVTPAAAAPPPPPAVANDKSKVAAGVFGILLGSLGVHKFYLGYTKEGVIMLLVSVLSFGLLAWVVSIVGLVEGILYLTKTDDEFYSTYVAGRKPWL